MEAWLDYEFEAMHLTRLEIEAIRAGTMAIASDNKREQAEWADKMQRLGLAPGAPASPPAARRATEPAYLKHESSVTLATWEHGRARYARANFSRAPGVDQTGSSFKMMRLAAAAASGKHRTMCACAERRT